MRVVKKVKGLEHHAYKPFTFVIKQQQLFLSNTAAHKERRDTPIKAYRIALSYHTFCKNQDKNKIFLKKV